MAITIDIFLRQLFNLVGKLEKQVNSALSRFEGSDGLIDYEKLTIFVEKAIFDVCWKTADMIFAPKVLLRQMVMIVVLQTSVLVTQALYARLSNISRRLTEKGRREDDLMKKLEDCPTYEEWLQIANLLDNERGLDEWRREDKCLL